MASDGRLFRLVGPYFSRKHDGHLVWRIELLADGHWRFAGITFFVDEGIPRSAAAHLVKKIMLHRKGDRIKVVTRERGQRETVTL